MSNEMSNITAVAQPAVSAAKQAAPQPRAAVPAPDRAPVAPAVQIDPEEMRQNLHEAIERLNEQVERNGRGLNFALDERLNRPVITVRSTASGEIIRQIPNEVVIKVAHSIEDIKGLLTDQLG
ncbi:flagellar protein FlaG [Comamonadaceae bacterium M7527]|nr:flagellar protein FlaG [Comamonadaceae bacterium M7527]